MPYDIGPKIGIDGEAEFRKLIKQISDNIKTLGSDLKVVASAADAEGESIESLSQKNDILNQTIAELERRLSVQQDMLDKAADKYGEADSKTQAWQRTVNATQTEINKLRSQINKNEQAMDDLANSTDDAGDAMDDLGDAADNSGGKLDAMTVAMGDLIFSGIQACISAVGNLISSIWNLDEATEEYRIAQGRLNTAFEAAGMSTEAAETAYTEFYKILGDTDTATEASQLLAQLTENEQDLTTWTRIAAGVSGTWGDSLPIESLIEAANETANVGTVTGTLADALNWVNISEDEFNKKLAECSDESERNQLIMETLSSQYDEAADAFYRTNETLIESRDAQKSLSDSMARIGESVATVKNELLVAFAPALEAASKAIADFVGNIDIGEAVQSALEFLGNLKDRLSDLVDYLGNTLEPLGDALSGLFKALSDALSPAIDEIQTFIETGETSSGVLSAIGGAFETVIDVLSTVVTWLSQFITWLSSGTTGAEIFKAVVVAIGTAFIAWKVISTVSTLVSTLTTIVSAAKTAFTAFNSVLSANPIGLIVTAITGLVAAFIYLWNNCESFRQFWINLWNNIKEAFAVVGEFIGQVIDSIVQWFSNAWQNIQAAWSSVTSWFAGIWDSIRNTFSGVAETLGGFFSSAWSAITGVWDAATGFFSGIWDGIRNTFSVVGDTLGGFFSDAWNAITGVWDGVTDWFSDKWDGIKNVFSNAWDVFSDIGSDIVNGIRNGISRLWDSLTGWFSNLWNGLVGGVKSFLGINSPSKVFADEIGANMALGVGVGFEDEMATVQRDIDRSMAGLVPSTSANVSVTGRSGASSAPYDIAGAINSALNGAIVYMDGRKVGKLITRSQNNDIRGAGLVPVS